MWPQLSETLAWTSGVISIWQWIAGVRFPLHARAPLRSFPGISIFKPLRDADEHTAECLRSWLTQVYPGPVQFLLGARSESDGSYAITRTLLQQFPHIDAKLVLCPESLGPNGKVSNLAQMVPHAIHPWFVVSDSDVWATEDLLAQLSAQLDTSTPALLTCLYQLSPGSTAATRWEATLANTDFWSQVLQAKDLDKLDFAMGAVMMLHRDSLQRIGGFHSVLEYLADDYQLGQRHVAAGGRIQLSTVVVECRGGSIGWKSAWKHQVRWARTIRFCKPFPFFLSILANQTVWALLAIAMTTNEHVAWSMTALLGLRAWAGLHLEARFRQLRIQWSGFWRMWFRDLAQFAVWISAYTGRTVEWQGDRFTILGDGKIQPTNTPPT